jgi:hypothetical protein
VTNTLAYYDTDLIMAIKGIEYGPLVELVLAEKRKLVGVYLRNRSAI